MRSNASSLLSSGVLALAMTTLAGACIDLDRSEPSPGPAPPEDCIPGAACTLDRECLALTDNAGASTFGLHIIDLDITQPPALQRGVIEKIIALQLMPDAPDCFASGHDLSSWMIQFDLIADTVTLGGIDPPEDPSQGASFLNETITQSGKDYLVHPVIYPLTLDAGGTFTTKEGKDVNLPINFDFQSGGPSVLPLRAVRMVDVTLSSSHNCIGRYQPETLAPGSTCLPDSDEESLLSRGGEVEGFMTLEDADTVVMGPIKQTLCVVLSGDLTEWGDAGASIVRCKREGGVISLRGDWCSATNEPASDNCFDAMKIRARFAASAMKILGSPIN